jgi:hypothetical protein
MERSEQIGDLMGALAKAQSEFTYAPKDSKNPAFNSNYADLASVITAVRPALSKYGVAFLQLDESDVERQTASVTTSLHHGEQWMSITAEAPATGVKGFNVQSLGAAWTYLRRYSLQALVGLASDDDDGNSLAVENQPTPKRAAKAQPEKEYVPRTNPDQAEMDQWLTAFAEAATLDEWNKHVVPLMKERGREFIIAASTEAKKRGYTADRASGLYVERRAQ